MRWWHVVLQADRRIAAIFVRYGFGEEDLGYSAPFWLAGMTGVAGWVRLWLWPRLNGRGGEIDWSSGDALGWAAFTMLVLAVSLFHVARSGRLARREEESQTTGRGKPWLMRYVPHEEARRDPRRFMRKWTKAQVVYEPVCGVFMATVASEASSSLAWYVATTFALLWWDSVRMARARRSDRLTYRDALFRQRYQQIMFEAARKGIDDGGPDRRTYRPRGL